MTAKTLSASPTLATLLVVCTSSVALAQSWPLGSVAPNTADDSAQANYCTLGIGPSSLVLPTKSKPGVVVVPLFQTGPTCNPFCSNPIKLLTWSGTAHMTFTDATSGMLTFDYFYNQGLVQQGVPTVSFTGYQSSVNKSTGGLTVNMTLTPSTSSCSVAFQGTYYKP